MLRLVIGMQNSNNAEGFTLIEILVVVLIIGITIGFALLAFGDFGGARRIVMSAEQFINYVKFIQHEAIIESNTLGISVNNNGYQVLRFNNKNKWQPLPNRSVFQFQKFPENSIVEFDKNKKISNPAIIINASGDMNEFKLNFSSAKDKPIVYVYGKRNGKITLHYVNKP